MKGDFLQRDRQSPRKQSVRPRGYNICRRVEGHDRVSFLHLAAMDDASAEPSLFFAGSDGEEDAAMGEPEPQSTGSRPKPALFLADSDDEEPHAFGLTTPTKRSIYIGYRKKDSDSDDSHRFDMTDLHPPDVSDFDQGADIPESEPIPRASSVSSMSSGPSINHKVSSPTPSIEIVEPPVKKRRIDPVSIAPPSTSADSIYLGSFIVGNAWSTARGKGELLSLVFEYLSLIMTKDISKAETQ